MQIPVKKSIQDSVSEIPAFMQETSTAPTARSPVSVPEPMDLSTPQRLNKRVRKGAVSPRKEIRFTKENDIESGETSDDNEDYDIKTLLKIMQ